MQVTVTLTMAELDTIALATRSAIAVQQAVLERLGGAAARAIEDARAAAEAPQGAPADGSGNG